MGFMTPRRTTQSYWMRKLTFHYSVLASICIIFLFLGAMVCINTCQLSTCEDHLCQPKSHWTSTSRRWLDRIFQVSNKQKSLSAFLVIVIMSSPGNMERRDTIRQTWLKELKSDVLHLFVIGTGLLEADERRTLESENARFQDLLFLANVNDTYGSLTSKLLYSLVWIEQNVEFSFLFKADDDTFARIDDIANELTVLTKKTRLYWGFFDGRAKVQKRGKWAERDWVLCDNYLPYALGGGYVLSSDLIQFISINKEYLKLYNNEDISLATWLTSVDVRRVHDPRFDTEYKSRGCFNTYLVTHKQSTGQMREKFWLLQEKGRLCASEQRERYSYEYNWLVPPSQCCLRNNSKIP